MATYTPVILFDPGRHLLAAQVPNPVATIGKAAIVEFLFQRRHAAANHLERRAAFARGRNGTIYANTDVAVQKKTFYVVPVQRFVPRTSPLPGPPPRPPHRDRG